MSDRAELQNIQRRASLAREEDREALLTHPEVIDVPAKFFMEGKVRVAEVAYRHDLCLDQHYGKRELSLWKYLPSLVHVRDLDALT